MRNTITKTKFKNNKGITLIALVITIIVLLILAGVSVSMLSGENGILNQATNAKKQTEQASTDEAVKLAALSALTAGNGEMKLDVLSSELSEVAGKEITVTELPTVVAIGNNEYVIKSDGTTKRATEIDKYVGKEITGSKVTLTDENEDKIVVPVGFKIKSDSPTIVDEGIVVVAPDESEFVWVPVKDVSTMYGTNSSGTKLGKLYDFDSNSYEPSNWEETDGVISWVSSSNIEPYYLTSTAHGDASIQGLELLKSIIGLNETDGDILTQWSTQLQNEFDEMIMSVGENKGFYVGRYETSLNTDKTKAQSKSGEQAATSGTDSANTWYGLYQFEKEYSSKNSLTDVVGSSMIWGSQYDQMMIWMQGNGIDVTESIGKNRNLGEDGAVGTTGTTSTDKINNIYDLYGNGYEYTLEADSNYRVLR